MHSVRGGGNSRTMSICQTERDRRELGAIRNGHVIVQHDYASELLENLTARERPSDNSISDPEREIDLILERCREEHVEGVITTDDYPGTTLASVVADKLNLAGPKPKANLICQHKFFSRQVQAAAAPEATPDFRLLDVREGAELSADHSFPLFVKPVKSFFSVGAQRVNCRKELDQIRKVWAENAEFFRPFEILLKKHTGLSIGTKCLIAEGLLEGIQTTLDGYVQHGEVHLMGVVDSIMFPGTIAFQRFEYPSSLPETVQQ